MIKLKENLMESIFLFIANLESKNKIDCLGYCIKYLSKHIPLGIMGAPWWAKYLYESDIYFNKIVFELSTELNLPYPEVDNQLKELALLIESQDSIGERWRTSIKNTENIKYFRATHLDLEVIRESLNITLDNDIFADCASEISSNICIAVIEELSEMHTFFRRGTLINSTISTSIFSNMLLFCEKVSFAQRYKIDNDSLEKFISLVKHISITGILGKHHITKHQDTNAPGPLLWHGKGTELLDLFVTLQEKGYIQLPGTTTSPGPSWENVCRSICRLFDLSKFRRADSKGAPWQTLETYFKTRSLDRLTGEERYDKLNYNNRKFDSIGNQNPDLTGPE